MAKWQAEAFRRRKHISSWCWEGREGSTCATIIRPFHNDQPSPPFPDLVKWQADAFGRHKHISVLSVLAASDSTDFLVMRMSVRSDIDSVRKL